MNGVITSSVWGEIATERDGSPGSVKPCRSCGAPILWIATRSGKRMPVDAKTDVVHFKTCPDADKHRNGGAPSGGAPNTGAPPTGPVAPTGPVWTGVVETVEATDPDWYCIRVKCATGDRLKEGDLLKVMRRAK